MFVSGYDGLRKYCQKVIFIEIQDGRQMAASEPNETNCVKLLDEN